MGVTLLNAIAIAIVLSLKHERIFVINNPIAEKTLSPDFWGAKSESDLRLNGLI